MLHGSQFQFSRKQDSCLVCHRATTNLLVTFHKTMGIIKDTYDIVRDMVTSFFNWRKAKAHADAKARVRTYSENGQANVHVRFCPTREDIMQSIPEIGETDLESALPELMKVLN